MATECRAPDCTDPAPGSYKPYCTRICEHVGLQIATELIDRGEPPALDALPDDEVAEIRADVKRSRRELQKQIEEELDA